MSGIRFDHIAIGLPSFATATDFVVGELGGRPLEGGPGPGYQGGQWKFANGGCLELIVPAGRPGGFLHRFLAARGAGIHHVTFKVPAIGPAVERARGAGYEVVGLDVSNPGWKEAFLHPKQALGIVVQLAESDPALDGSWGTGWAFPAAPTPHPQPAGLEGLRLVAPDEKAARRQWQEVLGAECRSDAAGLEFHWSDSPMRLSVEIDPVRPAGPLRIELSASRTLALPEREHPILGACFVQV